MDILAVNDISLTFRGLKAVDSVSFSVPERSIFSIIGPNGSGKTTVFNLINGIYKPDGGRIVFSGADISGLSPDRIARRGVARTFQNIELFAQATIVENILLGRHIHMRSGVFSGAFMWGRAAREETLNRQVTDRIIDFLGLRPMKDSLVSSLPYGKRKLVELGRAMALEPRLLLLDEPSAGMSPEEKAELDVWIRNIRDAYDVTVLLIEHDMRMVMGISDTVLVLDQGRVIARGQPQDIQEHSDVVRAYLGPPD